MVTESRSKVAVDESADPLLVLDVPRVVDAVLLLQRGELSGGHLATNRAETLDLLGQRRPRSRVDDRKARDGDDDQGDDHVEHTPHEKDQHVSYSLRRSRAYDTLWLCGVLRRVVPVPR